MIKMSDQVNRWVNPEDYMGAEFGPATEQISELRTENEATLIANHLAKRVIEAFLELDIVFPPDVVTTMSNDMVRVVTERVKTYTKETPEPCEPPTHSEAIDWREYLHWHWPYPATLSALPPHWTSWFSESQKRFRRIDHPHRIIWDMNFQMHARFGTLPRVRRNQQKKIIIENYLARSSRFKGGGIVMVAPAIITLSFFLSFFLSLVVTQGRPCGLSHTGPATINAGAGDPLGGVDGYLFREHFPVAIHCLSILLVCGVLSSAQTSITQEWS